jgi:cytochrome P450/NADPH-cytochrome P450 reductase
MTIKPIPQPKPSWLTGNLGEFKGDAPLAGMVRLAKQYGEAFYLDMFGRRLVFINSQELVNEICDENRFEKRVHSSLKVLRELVGDGLFTAYTKEHNWEKAHRLLMPAFGPIAVRGMFDQMLDIADQMFNRIERFGPNETFDVSETMTRLTLDTIALCAFDYRFNSFYREEMHPFVGAMVGALVEAEARGRRPPFLSRLFFKRKRQYDDNAALMQRVADDLIAERKRDPHRANKKDLLATMLDGRDSVTGEGLTDENIRHQLVTFLIAGHETTSGLLSFAVYLLMKNPQALEKIRAEVDSVLGTDMPRVEQLASLKYVEQVLQETLRLWPTAPGFALRPKQDTVIGGRFQLTREDTLMVLIPALHRDPAIWGDDAEDFRPERFEIEEAAKRPANSWKPFGNGQRACIGRAFALQEAQLVLAMLIQRFDLEMADPAYQLKVAETLTIKPSGFEVRAKRRDVQVIHRSHTGNISSRSGDIGRKPLSQTSAANSNMDFASTEALAPLLVLYGSNSGSSETFAKQIAREAPAHGFNANLMSLDDATDKLPPSGAVAILTASYEGHPTDNAKQFVTWLRNTRDLSLKGLQYTVFGCGNRQWARTFQAIPKEIDSRLADSGATRFLSRGEADASGDFFGGFDDWHARFWQSLSKATGVVSDVNLGATHHLEIEFLAPIRTEVLRQTSLQEARLVDNHELVALDTAIGQKIGRSKRHLEVELPAGMAYKAGDYLAVLPTNSMELVGRVLRRFSLSAETSLLLKEREGVAQHLPKDMPITAVDLLAGYVELQQPATRAQVNLLAANTRCPPELKPLQQLSQEPIYQTEVFAKRLSVLDLLERYVSCELSFAAFLEMLPPLKSRRYSISSSPLWNAHQCTLTVAVVDAPAMSGKARYLGVASSQLASACVGDKFWVEVEAAKGHFQPPLSASIPMVMVCAGTGLAPFRGFLQQRLIQKQKGESVATSLLFFGCDHPDVDFLYKEEFKELEDLGIVRVRTAFSALPILDVQFVQHRVWQDRADVIELFKQGAHIYVCGDGLHMAPAVRETLIRIYAEHQQVTFEQAAQWAHDFIEESGRFAEDVFS